MSTPLTAESIDMAMEAIKMAEGSAKYWEGPFYKMLKARGLLDDRGLPLLPSHSDNCDRALYRMLTGREPPPVRTATEVHALERAASRGGKTMAQMNAFLRSIGSDKTAENLFNDEPYDWFLTSSKPSGQFKVRFNYGLHVADWRGYYATLTPEDKTMARTVQKISIIPGESGVSITSDTGQGYEVHHRGNLPDALDLAHELLRPHVTDDGAPYDKKTDRDG